ncbi:DUF805 domain-containing protein [uncultured Succiniclasticum sp.]|uniref:DUF805 domain-containing protein n=1 Tax=uncultured Succiniclasticum sp. TaxID=1500547 RepID=UPI0025F2CFCD|nr:DUF805 domain-containing protein [uncultured Succiniclasticum sp.]
MIDKGDVTMKQCPACKKTYDDNTMFCKECGVALGTMVKSNMQQEALYNKNGVYEASDANIVTKPQQKYVPDKGIKKMFFSTQGRLNRKRYILRGLVIGAATSVGSMIATSLVTGALLSESIPMLIVSALLVLLMIILPVVSGFMLAVRRWHDLNKPGILALTNILILPGLYVLFAKGTEGPNKYGPDPLEISSEI